MDQTSRLFRRLRHQVEHAAAAGMTLEQIEWQFIDHTPLDEHQQACLWLIAQHEIGLRPGPVESSLFGRALEVVRKG